MNIATLVGTLSGAASAAVVVGAATRGYWTRREARAQAAFTQAVQRIVDASMATVIQRQTEFERRQGRHLDKQDRELIRLRTLIEERTEPRGH